MPDDPDRELRRLNGQITRLEEEKAVLAQRLGYAVREVAALRQKIPTAVRQARTTDQSDAPAAIPALRLTRAERELIEALGRLVA